MKTSGKYGLIIIRPATPSDCFMPGILPDFDISGPSIRPSLSFSDSIACSPIPRCAVHSPASAWHCSRIPRRSPPV